LDARHIASHSDDSSLALLTVPQQRGAIVALAEALGLPLITSDARLCQAPGLRYSIDLV